MVKRPAARYPHCGNRALFRRGPPPIPPAATVRQVSPSVQRQRAGFHVQQLEGCCRVAGERKGFAGLHLPAPQLNHIRPGDTGEEPGAAPSGPCQRVGICSAGIIYNAGSLATLTISATDTPSAAASLQGSQCWDWRPLFHLDQHTFADAGPARQLIQRHFFVFTVGLQPRGDGATYLVDIRSLNRSLY